MGKSILGLLVMFFSVSCLSAPYDAMEAGREKRLDVSIVNLIATPERYDKKKIMVSGYLTIEFENNSLCLFEHAPSSRECLWVNFDEGPYEKKSDFERYKKNKRQWEKYSKKIVTIHAVFDASDDGHMGAYSGALIGVEYVASMANLPPMIFDKKDRLFKRYSEKMLEEK